MNDQYMTGLDHDPLYSLCDAAGRDKTESIIHRCHLARKAAGTTSHTGCGGGMRQILLLAGAITIVLCWHWTIDALRTTEQTPRCREGAGRTLGAPQSRPKSGTSRGGRAMESAGQPEGDIAAAEMTQTFRVVSVSVSVLRLDR